jgi:hypothetical protein
MPALTQEQVSWNQASAADRRRGNGPSVLGHLAEEQPRPGPTALPEAFRSGSAAGRLTLGQMIAGVSRWGRSLPLGSA